MSASQGTSSLVPVFTGTLAGQSQQLCNARDLHAFLAVGRDFSNWIKDRIENGRFIEGEDYSPNLARIPGRRGAPRTDYHLTLDMAKHLALLENNEVGDQVRRYFIAVEKEARATVQKNPAVAALPAPEAISKELRHHVTATAQRITARQYDTIHAILLECVKDNLACGASQEACFGYVDAYAQTADGTVLANLRDLQSLVGAVAQVIDSAGTACATIKRIEARSGFELYGRIPRSEWLKPGFRKHDRLVQSVIDQIKGD